MPYAHHALGPLHEPSGASDWSRSATLRTSPQAYPNSRSFRKIAAATSGATATLAHTAILRRRCDKSTISATAKMNAASEFLVLDSTMETMPKTSNSMYHARFLTSPNTGIRRQSATIASTPPEVPTLFEASTGITPVNRPPSIASVGQIGRLIHTPTSDSP